MRGLPLYLVTIAPLEPSGASNLRWSEESLVTLSFTFWGCPGEPKERHKGN